MTSESIIGFYLLQAPIEWPRAAREENYSFVLEQSEGTQLDFLSAADRPAIWGTGDPVPKNCSFRADILSSSRNVTFQINSELFNYE